MQRRAEESNSELEDELANDDKLGTSVGSPDDAGGGQPIGMVGGPPTPVIIVAEGRALFRTLACLTTDQGKTRSWGYAEESRFEKTWRRLGSGAVVLEEARRRRRDALSISIQRAFAVAHAQLNNAENSVQSHHIQSSRDGVTSMANEFTQVIASAVRMLEYRGIPDQELANGSPGIK